MSAMRGKDRSSIEVALEEAGDCGLFHVWLVIMTALPFIMVGANMGAAIFETMMPKFYCDVDYTPWLEETCNMSQPISSRLPAGLLTSKQKTECYKYNFNPNTTTGCMYWNTTSANFSVTNQHSNPDVQACDSWIYDRSLMRKTIVTEFSLACGNSMAGYISQTTFMFGVLVGAITLGWIADRYGRRNTFLFCGVGTLITGVATAFSPTYIWYLVLRCINGYFVYGNFPILFILVSELVVARHRATFAQFMEVFFAVGLMLLSLLAYCTREWRSLHLALSIPCVITVILWWLLPESPRWLNANNMHVEAENVINRMRNVNAMSSQCRNSKEVVTIPLDDKGLEQETTSKRLTEEATENEAGAEEEKENTEAPGPMDMIRNKNIRLVSLVFFYQWFVISCVYYGLTLNAAELGGDPFINLFLNALGESISVLLVIPLVNRAGRRLCGVTSEIVAGIFCFLVSKIPPDITWLLIGCSLIGKFAIAMAFSVTYIHVGEMYPTPIRSVATGTCSAFARVGGIASPLIAMVGLVVPNLSYAIFAILAITSGLLLLLVPETNKQPMKETVEEGEAFITNNPGPLLIFLRSCGKKKAPKKATNDNALL